MSETKPAGAAAVPAGFSVAHPEDTPFVAGGLRAFFEYRDLGIKGRRAGASARR